MASTAPAQIRACQPGDRSQVLALAPRLTEGVAPWRDPAAVGRAAQNWVQASLDGAAQPGHAVYVAVAGHRVVGVVSVREQAHFTGQLDAYVGELAVAPGMERRGIATALMDAAEAWAAERGLAFLTLHTGAANQIARNLYRRLGFREEELQLTKATSTGQPVARSGRRPMPAPGGRLQPVTASGDSEPTRRCPMADSEFPAPQSGFVVTHFLVVSDQDRSREFYRSVFGATVVLERDPVILKIANSWLILNVGGGPTDDKPTVTLAPPADPDHASAFLNIRVADIAAAYADWSAKGAEFLTEPKDHGREIRAYIRDPDGHLIEVGQATGILSPE